MLLLRRTGPGEPGRGRTRDSLPGRIPLPADHATQQAAHPRPAAAQGGGAPLLVDVDGGDEDDADHDLLPERLDADDHEPVLQRGRDEHPDDAAEDGPVAAEQAGAADDHPGDHAQVGRGRPADRGRLEERQVEPSAEAGQQPGQGVDHDQVAADLQPGPPPRLGVRAERVGVQPEPGPVQQHDPEHHDDRGDDGQPRYLADDVAEADGVDHDGRDVAQVHAAGDDLGQAEGHPEGAQGDDEGRDLGPRDQIPVDQPPGEPAADGYQGADDGRTPALAAADVGHHLVGDDPAENQDAAYRQVDAAGDDHEGHPDAEDRQDGGVLHDPADVEHGQEAAGLEDREDDDDHGQHDDDLQRLQPAEPRQPAGRFLFARRRFGRRGRRRGGLPGHDWFSCVTAPVMAPTSSSIVVSFALYVATRRPSRMTCTSSATWITWGIEWLTNTTPRPRSRTRRISSRTPLVCTTPRAAVGSSSKTIRLAQAAARATATACFWPPDMAPMLPEKLRTVAPSSSNAFLLPASMSALFMNPSRPMTPERMTSRPRYMFCTGLR